MVPAGCCLELLLAWTGEEQYKQGGTGSHRWRKGSDVLAYEGKGISWLLPLDATHVHTHFAGRWQLQKHKGGNHMQCHFSKNSSTCIMRQNVQMVLNGITLSIWFILIICICWFAYAIGILPDWRTTLQSFHEGNRCTCVVLMQVMYW